MQLIADLHIHSRFSRATSRDLDFVALHRAALEKGIVIVGTGDFTHPGWMAEIESQLEPAEPGLFRLKSELARDAERDLPRACAAQQVRFVLQVEISNIYKKAERVRKNHNLVYLPDLEAAGRFTDRLATIGNIKSDGRPILGLDARDLLEITLETDPLAFLIPAHIWTPWFSMLGSKSGFDSIRECFGDLSEHIFAAETGLSSDPPMNWRVSELDRLTLVSNSDAHSAAKLGREANLLDIELSYQALYHAIKHGEGFLGTVEFYPEEGKYHLDGHRKCNLRLSPEETRELEGRCPVCGGKLTVGVMSRVIDLADQPVGRKPPSAIDFKSLVPLEEVVGESLGAGPGTKKVRAAVARLLDKVGPALHILQEAPLEDIRRVGGAATSEAVRRVRTGELQVNPGYDGEYGKVRIFSPGERKQLEGQTAMFAPRARAENSFMNRHNVSEPKEKTVSNENGPGETEKGSRSEIQLEDASNGPGQQTGLSFEKSPADRIAKAAPVGSLDPCRQLAAPADPLEGLDPYQRVAAETRSGPLLIVAGPGTGKTRTLVSRIAHQVGSGAVQQEQVLALSFTNQAAEELRERLRAVLPERGAPGPLVTTFHGLGKHLLETLGDTPVTLLEDEARETLVREVAGSEASPRAIKTLGHQISLVKQSSTAAELCLRRAVETSAPDDSGEQVSVAGAATEASFVDSARFAKVFCKYEAKLEASGEMDIDDLVLRAYRMLAADSSLAESVERRFRSVSVDEYQDVNDVQAALVRLLCPGGETLCAIGDPHQAIYGFRGAQPGHFQRFLDEYPGARQVRLDTTYRLTRQVLAAAQAALGVRDRLEAHRTGPEVELVTCPSARSEAEQVLVRLERIVGGTSYFAVDSGRGHTAEDDQAGFGDIAVLTRTRAQQRLILKALGRSAVPCRQVGEDEPHDPRAEKVAVMTMHAAKGREFQVVFVTGLEEGLMPLKLEGFDADPDEERRLLYVAITRAKHLAVLSLASRRVLFGKALPGALSPFLRDLPPDAVVRSVPGLPRPKDSSRQMSLF